jgi:hypothetical protein
MEDRTMRLSAKRGRLSWRVPVVTLLVVALLGVFPPSDTQAHPVFRGTITFEGSGLVANLEVSMHPPAKYAITFAGQRIDSGSITVTQSGSSVTGLVVSSELGRSCPFTATLSGGTATGTFLCTPPGESVTFVVNQV